MEGAELPLATATPCAFSPSTKQICADIVHDLEVASLKPGEADKEAKKTVVEKQPLVDRVVLLRNKTAELLVSRSDKPLRMIMNKLKGMYLTPALVVESGVVHLFDDMEPWKAARLGAEAEVLQTKWMKLS